MASKSHIYIYFLMTFSNDSTLLIISGQMRFLAILIAIIVSSSLGFAQSDQSEDDFVMLNAYRDFFSQATDFSLSFARFRPRGYDQRLSSLSWNGVPLENWENGTHSWSVMGNLSSVAQGADDLTTYLADLQKGGRVGGSLSNRSYTYRAGAGYAAKNFAVDVSRRWGESLSIDGVSANSYSFFATVGGVFGKHNIELALLYAPNERSGQRASTAEAYALTGNNLYNPAWGWQSGKRRNVRRNSTSQPIGIVTHTIDFTKKLKLHTTLSARVGSESRTALTWQNSPNPYPDYYRYMPSYQSDASLEQAWRDDPSVSQLDFQNLYDINGYNSPKAKYAIEERCRDVQQYRLASSLSGGVLSGGFELMYASNRNYKRIGDLLGAQYWLDIDAFVEQDDDVKELTQNNLLNPNFHARQGDVFGYDYTMTMKRAGGWIAARKKWGNYSASLQGRTTVIDYQRDGHFEKENFAGAHSYGRSPLVRNYDYDFRAEGSYNSGGKFRANLAASYRTLAPAPSQLFVSSEYRNAILPKAVSEKVATLEFTADYRSEKFRAKGTLYYTSINDKTSLLNFYDDNIHQYTHYWMQSISQRYVGIEFSAEFNLCNNLSTAIALALSDNRYTSNPTATQWRESTGEELRTDETVYYENLHTSGSPQSVAVVALKYNPREFSVTLTANYFDNNYIAVSPLRRTERTAAGLSKTPQEKLSGGVTLDLFAGRTFYFKGNQSIGIWMGVNNLLNNRSLTTGGYESFRTVQSAASDSRYYYALGINGFLSVTYRF